MHFALRLLTLWCVLGGLIPAAMLGGAIFVASNYSKKTKVAIGLFSGPSMWLFLGFVLIVSQIMALRHRMRRGKPLVPPPAPGNAR